MTLQLSIEYEKLLELVEQLSEEQQQDLLRRLLEKSSANQLSSDERRTLFESMTIDLGEVSPEYSDRRADGYSNI